MNIQVDKIPETEAKLLAMALLDGALKYYEDPKNVKAFKEWLKTRKQEQSVLLQA